MQSRKRVSWILFIVTSMATFVSGQIHAGQGDLIFHSSFERGEGCSVFNGLNDNILVPVVSISGDFTLNNEAFPGSEYDDAVFSLRDRLTGSVFELGNSHDHSYTANVVPGYYDVLYSLETASSPDALVPRNIGAVLMENVALLVNQTMDINVTGYSLGGDMLHNGVLFPASEYNDGVIFLDSGVKGRLQLGDTKQQTFSGVVALAGDYEVRYQAETPDTVPWNLWGLVDEINISGDNNALNINVESVLLEGSFLHNGVLMPATEYDDGNFYLETPGGDRALLDNSHAVNYEKTVIPGNYDIFWELETPGDTVPFNLRARVGSKVSVVSGKLQHQYELDSSGRRLFSQRWRVSGF